MVACDPGHQFAFKVGGPGGATIITWGYRLEDAPGGTDVTESFELAAMPVTRLYWAWALAGHWRLRADLGGMRLTLEKMRAVAERGAAEK